MAIFIILKSKVNVDRKIELTVAIREGVIETGLKFQLYETHHPSTFTVSEVTVDGSNAVIICEGSLPWEDAYVNHQVDTSDPKIAKLSAYRHG